MIPAEVAAQVAIRAVYGAAVAYTGAGLVDATIIAIRSDMPGASIEGMDGSPARVSFEIDKAAFPQEPRNGNRIVEAGGSIWSVIDTDFRPAIESWILFVEAASA